MSDYFRQNLSSLPFVSSDNWIILSSIELKIKKKIEMYGTPLKDWKINVNFGLKTGFNEAFIIDGAKRNQLIVEDPKSAEIIRPLLRGRDIMKYSCELSDTFLLYVPWHFPLHLSKEISGASEQAEKAFENQYPAIYNHLLSHKDGLLNRNKSETGKRYEWYALQRWGANYWEDFSKPKIVWKRVGSILRFSYDETGALALDSTCFATGQNIKFLVAILNSKFGRYLMKNSPKTGTGDLLISVQAIEPLFIPIPDIEMNSKFEALVDKLIIGDGFELKQIEQEIDTSIYDLFEFEEEEICFIESSL